MTSAINFVSRVRKIVAIGRNYADHAKELGNAVPENPMYFLKPTSSFVEMPNAIEIPDGIDVHHEVELGIVIGKTAKNIPKSKVDEHIGGYVLALDMTARNLQKKGESTPWTIAKGFDTFTAVGKLIPKSAIQNHGDVSLWLKVNEEKRQDGNTKDMIFDIPSLISHLSEVMSLEEGDLLLTGTPSGVGKVNAGDVITAGIGSPANPVETIRFNTVRRILVPV